MQGILDEILALLSIDGEGHSILEISLFTGLKPKQVETAFKLLESIEFVSLDGERATIDPTIKKLLVIDTRGQSRTD